MQHAPNSEVVRSATLERSKEFACAEGLQEALRIPIFFCLPHHPWERGDGLLRDWLSKCKSLDERHRC